MTVAGTEIASDGWIKDYDLGETGEIIPSVVGGSATTYMCDYHYCNASSTALRTLIVGGRASLGGHAGLGCFYSAWTLVQSRVHFVRQQVTVPRITVRSIVRQSTAVFQQQMMHVLISRTRVRNPNTMKLWAIRH
jgi:hypothetical protein